MLKPWLNGRRRLRLKRSVKRRLPRRSSKSEVGLLDRINPVASSYGSARQRKENRLKPSAKRRLNSCSICVYYPVAI